jgi:hypothetical protein
MVTGARLCLKQKVRVIERCPGKIGGRRCGASLAHIYGRYLHFNGPHSLTWKDGEVCVRGRCPRCDLRYEFENPMRFLPQE